MIKNIVEIKERKRKRSLREMINAMMYITKTGCHCRMLPKEFGPWQTVYCYFRKWKVEHIRHRRFENFIANMISALIAYNFQPQKPSLNLDIVDWDKVKNNYLDRIHVKIKWQFTNDNVRIKFKKLYLTILDWHDTRLHFGGRDHQTLFIVLRSSLSSVKVK